MAAEFVIEVLFEAPLVRDSCSILSSLLLAVFSNPVVLV